MCPEKLRKKDGTTIEEVCLKKDHPVCGFKNDCDDL